MKKIILAILLATFVNSVAFAQSIQDTQAFGGIIRNRRTGEKISIRQNIENPNELKVVIEEEGKAPTTLSLSPYILADDGSEDIDLVEHARLLGDADINYAIFRFIPGHDHRGLTALGLMFAPTIADIMMIQSASMETHAVVDGDERLTHRRQRRARARRIGGIMLLPVVGLVNIGLLPVTALTAGFSLLAQKVKEHRVEKLLIHLFDQRESGKVKKTSNRMFRFAKKTLMSRPSWIFEDDSENGFEDEEPLLPPVAPAQRSVIDEQEVVDGQE